MAREKTVRQDIEPQKTGWAESYTSLLLGLVVVVVVGFIIFSFIKGGEDTQQTSSVTNQETEEETEEKDEAQKNAVSPKTYTVVAGDDLWSIAEKQYKSGYNWVDIAKANKLANANILHVGNKLTIPDVKPMTITVEEKAKVTVANAIKGNQYTVVSGDNLWNISVRAYNDGYKWVEIAKANKLENPNLIFAGNKLKILR